MVAFAACITRLQTLTPTCSTSMNEAVLTFAEIVSGARLIPLTRGKFAIVDAEDYEMVTAHKWYAHSYGYAIRNSKSDNGSRSSESMHRLILDTPAGMETDHVSRNRLDNRRHNLRVATPAENRRNRGVFRLKANGLKGVGSLSGNRKFRARISFNGRSIRSWHMPHTVRRRKNITGSSPVWVDPLEVAEIVA